MKNKARLQGFTSIEDEVYPDRSAEGLRHLPLTYEGIFDDDSIKGDRHCSARPSKCLHGILDKGNLNRNIRLMD